jgi:tRNA modification GTPase
MPYHPDDTICAIATVSGGAARGMVRVSGPDAIRIVAKVFQASDAVPLDAIRLPTALAGHAIVELDYNEPRTLPCDVFLWPTARSYTRQPVAELHTLGSPPLLEALVAAVCRAGARLAEPGEFTLRAFLAGRIDLTQAEAVLGVIDAQGNEELNAALSQLAGGLARPLQQLRDGLLQLLAELEAGLDFVEEDIEFVSTEELLARLASASQLLSAVARQMSSRSTAGRAVQVALVGSPNTGKSSLFNAMVARCGVAGGASERKSTPAIVSPQRGTTRDYLTATIELDGVRFELVDTAGIDETLSGYCLPLPSGHRSAAAGEGRGKGESPGARHPHPALSQGERVSMIDSAAQSFAAERRAEAAIRLCCIDVTEDASQTPAAPLEAAQCDIVVLTKADLPRGLLQRADALDNVNVVVTSSRTGQGIDALCDRIRALFVNEKVAQQGQVVAATADRCRESIRLAEAATGRASEIATADGGNELVAAELHIALAELGKVVGAVYTDDLLDRIFRTFCIGK